MLILLLFILLIMCLFILFELSRNDFVLLRQNISQIQMFDYSAMTLILSLLVARLFYIVEFQKFQYLYPINFLHILHLPGLSMFGFYVGCAVILYLILRVKKGKSRIFDIFFLSSYPFIFYTIVTIPYARKFFMVPLLLLIIAVVLFGILLRALHNFKLKDGSITYIIFILISVLAFVGPFFQQRVMILLTLSLLQMVSMVLFVVCCILLAINQRIFKKRS